MDRAEIEQPLTTFLERVQKLRPTAVYLFGSWAEGRGDDYSDVDLVVLSDDFRNLTFDQRFDELYKLTANLYPDFHILGYTPQEWRSISKSSTLAAIKASAQRIDS